jgi:hypothetical protein
VLLQNIASGSKLTYLLVSAREASPGQGRLSVESPVGKAVMAVALVTDRSRDAQRHDPVQGRERKELAFQQRRHSASSCSRERQLVMSQRVAPV